MAVDKRPEPQAAGTTRRCEVANPVLESDWPLVRNNQESVYITSRGFENQKRVRGRKGGGGLLSRNA